MGDGFGQKVDIKVRFILAVVEEKMVINNRKKSALLAQLREEEYAPYPPVKQHGGNEEDDEDVVETSKDYDYLLSMPLWNLTMEKVAKLKAERDEKERQVKELTATAPEEMWVTDLDNIEEAWEETLRLKAAVDANAPKKKKKGGKKKKKKSAVHMDESDEDDWAPPVSKKKKKAVKKTKPIKKTTSSSLSSHRCGRMLRKW